MATNQRAVIDTYIATFPKEVQALLKKVKATIKKSGPKMDEVISYGIPTFDRNGRHIIHFAGFKKHISLFPGSEAIVVFEKELTDYKTARGTIQFKLDEPIPYSLIEKIVKFRIKAESTRR